MSVNLTPNPNVQGPTGPTGPTGGTGPVPALTMLTAAPVANETDEFCGITIV